MKYNLPLILLIIILAIGGLVPFKKRLTRLIDDDEGEGGTSTGPYLSSGSDYNVRA